MAKKEYFHKHPSKIDPENDLYDCIAMYHLKEEADEENDEFEDSLKNSQLRALILQLKEKLEPRDNRCTKNVLFNRAKKSNDPEVKIIWNEFLTFYKLINGQKYKDK